MNANIKITQKIDTRTLLSTLWVVVIASMVAADILSLFIPGALDVLVEFAGETPIPLIMLVMAFPFELAIVMIFLSRVMTYGVNRWSNILVAILTIIFIWGGAGSYPHYTFIASVETLFLLLILWHAWKWPAAEGW